MKLTVYTMNKDDQRVIMLELNWLTPRSRILFCVQLRVPYIPHNTMNGLTGSGLDILFYNATIKKYRIDWKISCLQAYLTSIYQAQGGSLSNGDAPDSDATIYHDINNAWPALATSFA